ncbi:hypothetical protein [Chlamydiifrater volucris]|nr:hypothetical protein [Chlamydiifrater volucris]
MHRRFESFHPSSLSLSLSLGFSLGVGVAVVALCFGMVLRKVLVAHCSE